MASRELAAAEICTHVGIDIRARHDIEVAETSSRTHVGIAFRGRHHIDVARAKRAPRGYRQPLRDARAVRRGSRMSASIDEARA
jgi:hypothetical protein